MDELTQNEVFWQGMIPILFILSIVAIVCYVIDELRPVRQYGFFENNPYSYVNRKTGAFGVDFEKMLREDPEFFDKHYMSQMRKFQEHFEAKGHKFINGRIEPPIVLND